MAAIITPEATLSYPHLFQPQAGMNKNDKPKYSCSLVFTQDKDISALRTAANEALIEKFGAKAPELVKTGKIRSPFRTDNCEEKGYPAGSVYINVKSDGKPGLVDRVAGPDGKPKPITDPADLYAGARVRASVSVYAYDNNGNKGVAFGLNNLQKLGEGERIDGRKRAEDEFEVIEDEAASLL